MPTLHNNTMYSSDIKYVHMHFCAVNHKQGIRKKKKGKTLPPLFLTCRLMLAETCSQWPDADAPEQCSLKSTKHSTFQLRQKVIVQSNKEVKLYIPNHTEKHLKHQYNLIFAALLHVIYKQGEKRRNASLHQPCTCFLH